MKTLLSAAVLGGVLLAQSAQAACDYPVAPGKIPDGSVASREEMLASKKEVTKYDADMNTYLQCIRAEFDASVAAQADATPQQRKQMERVHTQKEDAALAEVKDVVGRLNEQLKTWKEKNAPTKKSS